MRSLLYIFILLIITSCSYSELANQRLDDAQSMLARNPEKALNELNRIDVSELRDSDAVARWSLLYSEAMAANHIYAPTDTIVNVAIDFYSRHKDLAALNRAKAAQQKLSASKFAVKDSLAEARYLQKEREYRIYIERSQRERYVLISVIVLIAALVVIIYLMQNLRIRKAQNNALMAEASGLKLQLQSASDETSRMQSALHDLLDKRFALIDGLCDTYYQSQGTKNERKAIADRVKSEIETVRTDPEIFSEMEKTVNECRNNLLTHLKEYYPGIKSEEYQLTTFLACGFSSRTISLFLNESIENIYKRKSRLKQRIRAQNPPDDTEIMAIF
ncbi:hypothetical protein BFS16_03985 [Hoylesella timonensis]|jgi:hypothetical protein|uniref:Uncharacterized protein n=1 Tax=Hoylesella timonensis TaxID=386414 RepID=A0A2K0XM06_9BACT|nr:hypothetical protein [Hoylesella timonensis]PNP95544.1 hypothetical protein BFS16_03985 [Hoylesella timonensis]